MIAENYARNLRVIRSEHKFLVILLNLTLK